MGLFVLYGWFKQIRLVTEQDLFPVTRILFLLLASKSLHASFSVVDQFHTDGGLGVGCFNPTRWPVHSAPQNHLIGANDSSWLAFILLKALRLRHHNRSCLLDTLD